MTPINYSTCPICNSKFEIKKLSENEIEKHCKTKPNHVFVLLLNSSKEVTQITVSLAPNFTQYIIVDYKNNKSEINFKHPTHPKRIEFNYALTLDLPDLKEVKFIVDSALLLS